MSPKTVEDNLAKVYRKLGIALSRGAGRAHGRAKSARRGSAVENVCDYFTS